MQTMKAGTHDRTRKYVASERPCILADDDGDDDAQGGDRALREEPQIRRRRDQNSWRTETHPCDAERDTPRSADHGAARLRKAGRDPNAGRRTPCRPYRRDRRLL